jgi:ATP-dependent DNA helicase RecQ
MQHLPSPVAGSASDSSAGHLAALLETVERVWGYRELRPLQGEAMLASLRGRDALVVMATGGGKSLCYQAPALLREGLTVVISPLISLMQDQVASLAESGVPAAALSSAMSGAQKHEIHQRLGARELRLLFMAPERLMVASFAADLAAWGVETLVVDEAHCISHWGHDFRPEYRRLGQLRAARPQMPIQAFTATATPQVQADIAKQLGLRDPLLLVGSFDRPNLTYRFAPRRDTDAQVLEVIRRHSGEAGIVYCLRRTDVDSLAQQLAASGVRCLPYHAGLDADVRQRNQELFLAESVDVIVATVAFGMGIDRPDVRFVVHAALPKGVEQFAQETGRAGRDGLPAECVLFYSGADYHGWKQLQERSAAEARANGVEIDPNEAQNALARLSEMYGWATSAICRHKFLVEHFGQAWTPQEAVAPNGGAGCGACDVCLGELATVADSQRIAQMILSCVVRCEQRYGASHVTDVLCGVADEKLKSVGHDKLTTFGLLRQRDPRQVRHWIEQLVGLELLVTAAGRYPTLSLTRAGVEAMHARLPVTLFEIPQLPRSRRSRRPAVPSDIQYDETLFEKLRQLRRNLASERGVPPYMIFGDRTLQELAALQPTDVDELRGVRGVGAKKLDDLGPLFLEAIRAHVQR